MEARKLSAVECVLVPVEGTGLAGVDSSYDRIPCLNRSLALEHTSSSMLRNQEGVTDCEKGSSTNN
jgi:hypothetical protein